VKGLAPPPRSGRGGPGAPARSPQIGGRCIRVPENPGFAFEALAGPQAGARGAGGVPKRQFLRHTPSRATGELRKKHRRPCGATARRQTRWQKGVRAPRQQNRGPRQKRGGRAALGPGRRVDRGRGKRRAQAPATRHGFAAGPLRNFFRARPPARAGRGQDGGRSRGLTRGGARLSRGVGPGPWVGPGPKGLSGTFSPPSATEGNRAGAESPRLAHAVGFRPRTKPPEVAGAM